MTTEAELTDVQRTVLLTMAAGQTSGVPLGPADIAAAASLTEADVLRALADLSDAGLIRSPAGSQEETDPVAEDPDRLPRAHRAVLLALMAIAEATPADLADDVDGGEPSAAQAIEELTAGHMVAVVGSEGAVCHTDDGWMQAEAEVAAGPAAGDPPELRMVYGLWATISRKAAAQGHSLSDAASAVMAL